MKAIVVTDEAAGTAGMTLVERPEPDAAGNDVVADPDDALGDVLEPGEHSQRRGLAGAGRADQDHELSVRDREVHVRDRLYAVGVALGHVFENYARHAGPFLRATGRARRLRRTAARRRLRRT